MDFRASGDTGLTVVLGNQVNPETSQQVLRLADAIERAELPGVIEVVPTYLSLLVHYDPLETSQSTLIEALDELHKSGSTVQLIPASHWSFPLCVEEEAFAPDLASVASFAKQTEREVVQSITGADLTVYMLGFAPGQPYMGDLPSDFSIPRRESPIHDVPAGSVLTATGKIVIYPNSNPTGWHIVGRTPVPIFDKLRDHPVLLSPGDKVRFHEVTAKDYQTIKTKIGSGDIDPTTEFLR